jgi:ankyrin repeat protein
LDGADVNARDNKGRTALMFAARHNRSSDIVMALLDAGADIHVKSKFRRNAWKIIKRNLTLKGSAAYLKLKDLSSK